MVERIDFALRPGAILVAAFFFVLANVLLAAALYPYFRGDADQASSDPSSEEMTPMVDSTDPEPLEQRVDEFLQDIHEERES
jgi:hypothetical protein